MRPQSHGLYGILLFQMRKLWLFKVTGWKLQWSTISLEIKGNCAINKERYLMMWKNKDCLILVCTCSVNIVEVGPIIYCRPYYIEFIELIVDALSMACITLLAQVSLHFLPIYLLCSILLFKTLKIYNVNSIWWLS